MSESPNKQVWNEWFAFSHRYDIHLPEVSLELWRKRWFGNDILGVATISFQQLIDGTEYLVDQSFSLTGCKGAICARIINLDALPSPEKLSAAINILENHGAQDEELACAAVVADLKTAFPKSSNDMIVNVCVQQRWSRIAASHVLNTNPSSATFRSTFVAPSAAPAAPAPMADLPTKLGRSSGIPAEHQSHLEMQKNRCIDQVAAILPHIERDGIREILEEHNWNIHAAVNEIVTKSGQEIPETIWGRKITAHETTAETGGFVTVDDSDKMLHSSQVVEPVTRVGKNIFDTRKHLFERGLGGS